MKKSIFIMLFLMVITVHASAQDNKNSSEEKYTVDEGFDGNVLWRIFDEPHILASKKVKPPKRAAIRHQKRYMLNVHIGRRRSDSWLCGVGGELKLGNIVFPITIASTFNVSKDSPDKKGFLSLGMSVHFPGNLLSSNVGAGAVRNIFTDDTISYYGLFGVELLNIIYGEYQAVREKPDWFRFGLRFFI
ncbi:hypothetical protein FJZ31_30950 [Candidatus Poribacteria bacterium]|nr:hypothetical protein [Candidatus Poribacteria bacterium]